MAEGGGLLNRYRALKPYRGFESLSLRQFRHWGHSLPDAACRVNRADFGLFRPAVRTANAHSRAASGRFPSLLARFL